MDEEYRRRYLWFSVYWSCLVSLLALAGPSAFVPVLLATMQTVLCISTRNHRTKGVSDTRVTRPPKKLPLGGSATGLLLTSLNPTQSDIHFPGCANF